jgi:hypothetical protein
MLKFNYSLAHYSSYSKLVPRHPNPLGEAKATSTTPRLHAGDPVPRSYVRSFSYRFRASILGSFYRGGSGQGVDMIDSASLTVCMFGWRTTVRRQERLLICLHI